MNEITIDLKGIKTKDQVLEKIGQALEFVNWGMNWDALNDSLESMDAGGIEGTGKKFKYPIKVIFENNQELQENDSETFNTLREIFEQKSENFEVDFK